MVEHWETDICRIVLWHSFLSALLWMAEDSVDPKSIYFICRLRYVMLSLKQINWKERGTFKIHLDWGRNIALDSNLCEQVTLCDWINSAPCLLSVRNRENDSTMVSCLWVCSALLLLYYTQHSIFLIVCNLCREMRSIEDHITLCNEHSYQRYKKIFVPWGK